MQDIDTLPEDIRPIFVIGSLVVACSARVSRCPAPGETLRASGFVMEAGGKGFNVALAARRLGVPVDGLFAVGDDAPGDFIRQSFARVGLPARLIMTVAGATGAGVGMIEDDGENRIAVFPGANDRLSKQDIEHAHDRVCGASLVIGQFEAPDEPILAAFSLAKAHGVRTLLNPSPYRRIDPAIVSATDILVLNESEAWALWQDLTVGEQDIADLSYRMLADMLARCGVPILIVTHGRCGATLWQQGECVEQAGFAVETVDSIGAGDAFTGGVIAALLRNLAFADALRWGCAAGAITVGRLGLVDALPTLAELAALMDRGVIAL